MGLFVRWRALMCVMLTAVVLDTTGCGSSDAEGESEVSQTVSSAVTLTDNTAGKLCTSDKDCGTGFCNHELPGMSGMVARAAPDGFCTFACRINVDCGAESACIGAGNNGFSFNTPDEKGLCLAACDAVRPCREGYVCEDLFGYAVKDGMSQTGFTVGSCRPPGPAQDSEE